MSELVLEKSLPIGWIKTTIDEISTNEKGSIRMGPFGSQLKKHELVEKGIRVLWIENIVNNKFEYKKGKFITKTKFEKLKGFAVKSDDVLVTMMGTIGRTCVVPEELGQAIISSHLLKITPRKQLINPVFLTYLLRGDQHILKQIESKARGVVMKGLNTKIIKSLDFLLPPLNEQKRIVKKIEDLFSLIDLNLKKLEYIENQLNTYEKSLLLFAFNGNLTNTWRLEHPEMNGKETLENSLEKRHQLWDEKEKSVKKPRKYLPPIHPSLSNLPQIPDMWMWASFEEISEIVIVGFVGSMRNEYVKIGIPFLRSQNVRKNRFDEKGLKFISQKFHKKITKSKLSPNDVVAVRSGDVGISCVIPDVLTNSNCSDLLIVKNPLGINPHFGAFYLNSIRESRIRQQQVGIALTHFNTKSLAKLAIPIPNLEEQNLMVMIISSSYSFMNNVQMILEQTRHKLIGLKNSILKQAFEGKLVPQDPNDEPAEILLQKIKQEKEQLKQKEKSKKRKKNGS